MVRQQDQMISHMNFIRMVVRWWMTKSFNRVWEEEKVPKKSGINIVTLLHKAGYKSKNELKN